MCGEGVMCGIARGSVRGVLHVCGATSLGACEGGNYHGSDEPMLSQR